MQGVDFIHVAADAFPTFCSCQSRLFGQSHGKCMSLYYCCYHHAEELLSFACLHQHSTALLNRSGSTMPFTGRLFLPQQAAVSLFCAMKNVFTPADQDWMNARFRIAANKRWKARILIVDKEAHVGFNTSPLLTAMKCKSGDAICGQEILYNSPLHVLHSQRPGQRMWVSKMQHPKPMTDIKNVSFTCCTVNGKVAGKVHTYSCSWYTACPARPSFVLLPWHWRLKIQETVSGLSRFDHSALHVLCVGLPDSWPYGQI